MQKTINWLSQRRNHSLPHDDDDGDDDDDNYDDNVRPYRLM